jgi:hypothetical protein
VVELLHRRVRVGAGSSIITCTHRSIGVRGDARSSLIYVTLVVIGTQVATMVGAVLLSAGLHLELTHHELERLVATDRMREHVMQVATLLLLYAHTQHTQEVNDRTNECMNG